ncbi:hypothetical protein Nepgr_005492 [Nepenthes gracilis]|uniref:non-specific serine/threonine protein kinase n=1 Tax=Nepenthes gracilis TaxID=150966 RepID=A0AAD3S3C4_NEPGR|nr:hypothetical protein Nepgr_005492 [Nepenthes gracilis]
MKYLNGGDLYSLLRNLSCLDEDMAWVYLAEVVLGLEYLHSLNAVHRDVKPDDLLISLDGHLKLTDVGLSKVGLINSTNDLSGPSASSNGFLDDDKTDSATQHSSSISQAISGQNIGCAIELVCWWWSPNIVFDREKSEQGKSFMV